MSCSRTAFLLLQRSHSSVVEVAFLLWVWGGGISPLFQCAVLPLEGDPVRVAIYTAALTWSRVLILADTWSGLIACRWVLCAIINLIIKYHLYFGSGPGLSKAVITLRLYCRERGCECGQKPTVVGRVIIYTCLAHRAREGMHASMALEEYLATSFVSATSKYVG